MLSWGSLSRYPLQAVIVAVIFTQNTCVAQLIKTHPLQLIKTPDKTNAKQQHTLACKTIQIKCKTRPKLRQSITILYTNHFITHIMTHNTIYSKHNFTSFSMQTNLGYYYNSFHFNISAIMQIGLPTNEMRIARQR